MLEKCMRICRHEVGYMPVTEVIRRKVTENQETQEDGGLGTSKPDCPSAETQWVLSAMPGDILQFTHKGGDR